MYQYIKYFNELIESGSLFWFCALVGSGMFLIQFIMNIFGIFDTSDLSSDTLHDGAPDSADASKFKWLSMQTITGFLMMFGWTAITCKNQFGLQDPITIVIALASGLFAALIISSIFKLTKKLRSSGSIYRLEEAIGKEAYVYQCIPKGGKGKISISLQNFTHEIDAISHFDEELPSFMRVKIIKKSDDNIIVVAPL